MSNSNDDRDEERDWHDDQPHPKVEQPDQLDMPEAEDDAAKLPIRHPPHRGPAPRRRGTYRPPSELDRE